MAEAPDINVDDLRRRARRRLLGAIVLALAAAIIVPMLFEGEPKPLGEDVSVRIPPEDNAKFVNRLSDNGTKSNAVVSATKSEPEKEAGKAEPTTAPAAPPESTSAVTNVPAPKKSIALAEQKVLGGTAKPAGTPAPAPAAAAVVVPAAAPSPAGSTMIVEPSTGVTTDALREGYSVQLAAFADDKGANALANKLKRADYPAYTEPLTTSKGTLWRVRVGPYPSRDAAIDIRDKLKGEGYSGIVAVAK